MRRNAKVRCAQCGAKNPDELRCRICGAVLPGAGNIRQGKADDAPSFEESVETERAAWREYDTEIRPPVVAPPTRT
jgi:hypothetical protein